MLEHSSNRKYKTRGVGSPELTDVVSDVVGVAEAHQVAVVAGTTALLCYHLSRLQTLLERHRYAFVLQQVVLNCLAVEEVT